jgi:hypothetical protein
VTPLGMVWALVQRFWPWLALCAAVGLGWLCLTQAGEIRALRGSGAAQGAAQGAAASSAVSTFKVRVECPDAAPAEPGKPSRPAVVTFEGSTSATAAVSSTAQVAPPAPKAGWALGWQAWGGYRPLAKNPLLADALASPVSDWLAGVDCTWGPGLIGFSAPVSGDPKQVGRELFVKVGVLGAW